MAFNNGFPLNYPQAYYPQTMGAYPQQNNLNMQGPQVGQNTGQQSGFIPVPSEEAARSYPVAPGNSVSFKNEKEPYIYVKTMGYSPLDMPTFEKFRLVKEEAASEIASTGGGVDLSQYALKSDLDAVKNELQIIKKNMKINRKKEGSNE